MKHLTNRLTMLGQTVSASAKTVSQTSRSRWTLCLLTLFISLFANVGEAFADEEETVSLVSYSVTNNSATITSTPNAKVTAVLKRTSGTVPGAASEKRGYRLQSNCVLDLRVVSGYKITKVVLTSNSKGNSVDQMVTTIKDSEDNDLSGSWGGTEINAKRDNYTWTAGNSTLYTNWILTNTGSGDIYISSVAVTLEAVVLPDLTAPTITLAGTTATITSAESANIYYTIDGTTPTESSTLYTSALENPSVGITIKAIAVKNGYNNSAVSSADVQKCAIPVIVVDAEKKLTITSATENTQIYYHTSGQVPTAENGGQLYSSSTPITVNGGDEIWAVATKDGYLESAIAKYSVPEVPILYTISYELFGHGSKGGGWPNEGSTVPSVTPSDSYYNFNGWYTNQSLTSAAVAGTTLTKNTTLYAKWTKKESINPISDETTLTFTFSSVPSNTANFDWMGTIQNADHTKATSEDNNTDKSLKFDSKGSLKFETSKDFVLDLYFSDSDAGNTIKIDNTEYTIDENCNVNVPVLSAGVHTIARGNKQTLLPLLKLTNIAIKPSDLAISPADATVFIKSESSPFTITSSSDGNITATINNSKASVYIDGDGQLVVVTNTATLANATITVTQEATSAYEGGTVTATISVVKPKLETPTITCEANVVTITSNHDMDGEVETINLKYKIGTTGEWQSYTSPFTITENCTIYAKTDANNYNDSEEAHLDATYETLAGKTVTFDANGGTCTVDEPLTEEAYGAGVTLPSATKADHTFVGWSINPSATAADAGLYGNAIYKPATNITLYAVYVQTYKVWEIDLTSTGAGNGLSDKTGVSISSENNVRIGNYTFGSITMGGNEVNERFVVQTGTSWIFRNNGMYNNNSGNRSYGIKDCLAGDYITIESSTNPSVTDNATLISVVGNVYTYKVLSDGGVAFRPARYQQIYKAAIYSTCPHNVSTDDTVGDDDPANNTWWKYFSQFYKVEKGNTYNYHFTVKNAGSASHSYDNWVLLATTVAQHNGDALLSDQYLELLALRADGHGWTDGYNGSAKTFKRDGSDFNAIDNADFISDMKSGDVDVKVSVEFTGTKFIVTSTMITSAHTYVLREESNSFTERNDAYLFFTVEKSQITDMTYPIEFLDKTPSVTLSANGTYAYEQKAIGNPSNAAVSYTVTGTTGSVKASISQEPGSREYVLSVSGTGTVTVQANCNGQTDTYTLTVEGLMFEDPSPVIAHNITSYTPTLSGNVDGVTYSLVTDDTTESLRSVTVNSSTGALTNIPTETGGIIVVRATKDGAVADYCLTVANDLCVWDTYESRLHYGSIVEETTPGSASYVIYKANSSEYKNAKNEQLTRVSYNDYMDGVDYYAKENFYNSQNTIVRNAVSGVDKNYPLIQRYWKFTYKTCTYVDGVRTYVNQPLFAYRNAVVGDNGRIVKETAGLRYNAAPLAWGVSDNDLVNGEGANAATREKDRCILMKVGTSLTVPRVKVGRYVRLHWYRHSDNNGDRFKVKNALDLDGNAINPEHILRFTGSTYYGNTDGEYKGSTIFQVAEDMEHNYIDGDGDKCSDLTITITNIGWTEIYRVEIMDHLETEQQLCEVLITKPDGNINNWYSTTDNQNSKDINDPVWYNNLQNGKTASKVVSKIATNAKGAGLIEYAPDFYISGYAGHCYTWNGWLNTTVEVVPEVGSTIQLQTNNAGEWGNGRMGNSAKILPIDKIWVGQRLRYTMHHINQVKGVGTMRLIFRTHTGWTGEPHYTLNKTEAYVAVGEYSVQDYPYTWDFTKYNMEETNAYSGKSFEFMADGDKNTANQYGNWNSGVGTHGIGAYTTLNENDPQTSDGHKLQSWDVRHKPFFAQGSQLTIGDGANHTILEAEGLRINIPAVDSNNDNAVTWTEKNGSSTARQRTLSSGAQTNFGADGTLIVNGTITIPEVPQGMFVFVRSANQPTSVEGAESRNNKSNNSAEINSVHVQFYDMGDGSYYDDTNVKLNNGDIPANVWVYEQTLEGNHDVVITPNGAVEALGVTNYFKPMTKSTQKPRSTWGTDARNERIDYSNTGIFTKHDLKAYTATSYTMPGDEGTLHLEEIKVVPASASTGNGHGLVVYDGVKASDEATVTPRPLLPLFVPACNIQDEAPNDTYLKGLVNPNQQIDGTTGKNFTLTDQYYMYSKSSSAYVSDVKVSPEISFYILRESGEARANSAYLQLSEAHARARALYLVISDGDSEIDGIEDIELGDAEVVKVKSIYTLSGTRLNTLPTKKGIYIINGKKVYIK